MNASWIAVDWGTSNVRAWAMDGASIIASASGNRGMGSLTPEEFEPAFFELAGDWVSDAPIEVIVCGMAGSRQGWAEAKYLPVPAPPLDPQRVVTAKAVDPRLSIRIFPGLSQADPADVMRGEETQIAGLLAVDPEFDGVVCLPGTHTKWARISAGEVCFFATAMTGEMFSLMAKQSVLRHSMGDGWDDAAFSEGVDEAYTRPQKLATQLFGIRAQSLLNDAGGAAAKARLSGLLIGAELAAMKPYWLGQAVTVIGDAGLSGHYVSALAQLGLDTAMMDGTEASLGGLIAARRLLNNGVV